MKNTIRKIIVYEFTNLIKLIEADFESNYKRKVNNFLLNQMDKRITASMVFVSSFESKSGIAIEACAKKIACLTFGKANVPSIVNPRNLIHSIDPSNVSGQVVVTDVDTFNGDLRGEIASFRANNQARGKGRSRIESGITHASLKSSLLPLSNKYKSSHIFTKPVDLAFFDGTNWNIMELKAGGELDSSNAPSNVEKLLTIYVDMGIQNCNPYFATFYNKNGEGRTWTGSVKKHLNYPSMFLIGSRFWERILPSEVTFNNFTEIYREALEEINLNNRINNIINEYIGG